MKRIPWKEVSANITRRNPGEWVDAVNNSGKGKVKTVKYLYKFTPGGPHQGKLRTRLPFKKGDQFYWIGGLAKVVSVTAGKG
jgi:hypothetical protein